MPLTILYYQPDTVTDTTSNGGRMSNTNQIVASLGGAGNFSPVTPQQQASGITKYRKVFTKIADASNPTVLTAYAYLSAPSSLTDTRAYIVAGTQRDQQAALGPRKYATGILHTAVTAGATSLVVDFEAGSGADLVVQAGDIIAIEDGSTQNFGLTVASVTWATDQATITLTTGVLNDFTTSAAVAACIVGTASANCVVDNVVKSFSTSTYNESLITTGNLATDEQTITLTITGATTFSVLSDRHGALAAGSTASDYAPTNATFALPYFTLPAAGWGGTHTVGETLQFQIHPAAIPVWVVQKVSAGAASGIDSLPLKVYSES